MSEAMQRKFFTSESVTRGHPDKVCDQIADRILDAILEQDPEAHVAFEVTACTDRVHIFGEVTADAAVPYEDIARRVIAEIGYTAPWNGFDAENCRVDVEVHEQSPDIARGIKRKGTADAELDAGAGDQGMMFGYACRQTEHLMPLPIELAHSLCKRLESVRQSRELPFLLPDGKAQVTVEYEDDAPSRIASVVVSSQHEASVATDELRREILSHVILPTLPSGMMDNDTQIFINPTGRFVLGGPACDAGLTGRKIIVDTYGGFARHGGGAFSGKDASKVDRSGAYLARYIAKNVVYAGLADQCEVQLGYAIGLADPLSFRMDTFGTGKLTDEEIARRVISRVDMRPAAIIRQLGLDAPVFSRTACYGHFGSNAAGLPWERTDLAEQLC